MILFYKAAVSFYIFGIRIAALFGNSKAQLFLSGRKNLFSQIRGKLKPNEKRIWVHAASLGEFEQGRPIIEKIKEKFADYKIVLTFFSPSGYEIRKNYAGADYIFYLPTDTKRNARLFIESIQPTTVFFIKYEYWFYLLSELHRKNIPTYLCSSIFRPSQLFFKWYGAWFRNILGYFNHIFVQTEESKKLLESINIHNVTKTGDTRFDRVYSIAATTRELQEIAAFTNNIPCVIAGSSWQPDEELLCKYINETSLHVKFIFAPHEIDDAHIQYIEKLVSKRTVKYSAWKDNQKDEFDVLIIDNIGMLSSLYKYGNIAYIGGGFGKGIHNILEAATFGLPVLFGPNHQKFREAIDMINQGGAFPITNYEQLKSTLDNLLTNSSNLSNASTIAQKYVIENIGATEKIIASVF